MRYSIDIGEETSSMVLFSARFALDFIAKLRKFFTCPTDSKLGYWSLRLAVDFRWFYV